MCSISHPPIPVIDKFHRVGHFGDGSLSLATNPATSIRQISKKRPFGAQLKPLMGVIKSGLMFPMGDGRVTRMLLLPHYCFSSAISHFGVINYQQRFSEWSVAFHLTADQRHMGRDSEIRTQRIISGMTLDKSPTFSGPV